MRNQHWTDDQIASPCRLRNQGHSATQCARARGTSRGAILGELSRHAGAFRATTSENRDNAEDDGASSSLR